MSTSVDQAYCGWSHEELPCQEESQVKLLRSDY